jgi:hypothetical protein
MISGLSGVSGSGSIATAQASAARGIATGSARLADASQRMVDGPDVQAAVDMKTASAQIRASVAVSRTADEMTGTLIDALA